MSDPIQTISVAQEIRLSLGPVFVLSALAALAALLSQRLTRCADLLRAVPPAGQAALTDTARAALRRRMRVIQWSIQFSVASGIAICFVVIAIFANDTLAPDLSLTISVLFILSMTLIVASLLMLLADVGVSVSRAAEEDDLA